MKLILASCLFGCAAMLVSMPAPAQTPSPRACDAARRSGRVLPSCQRPQPTPPAPRQTLPPGAARMRDALASVPEAQWQRWDDARFDGADRILRLGTFSDLEALAQSGSRRAQFLLGWNHLSGTHGAPQDSARAAAWNRQAAEAGDARAQFRLAGLQTEEDRRWMRRAATAGHINAMYHLGLMFAQGLGGPRDDAEAVRWYRRAALAGHDMAMAALGNMYVAGRGVPRNDVEALRLYRQSAALGNSTGMHGLGFMYAEGRGGLARDEAEAVRWWRQAALSGVESSARELDRRGITWRPVVIAPARAAGEPN